MKQTLILIVTLLFSVYFYSQNNIIRGKVKINDNEYVVNNLSEKYILSSDSINLYNYINKNVLVTYDTISNIKTENKIYKKTGREDSIKIYSIKISNIKLNDNYNENLTKNESDILNQYLKNKNPSDNFENNKLIFVKGNYQNIITKDDFFYDVNQTLLKNDSINGTFYYKFNDKDKIKSGGFDGIIISWSKLGMYEKRKNKIIEKNNKLIDDKN